MYYEVYIDVLFLVNFLMDYILLLIVKQVLRCRGSYGRMCLGALLGAVLTCLVVAIQIPCAFVNLIVFHALVTPGMLLAGLSIHGLREFFKALAALYISGFLVGGIFSWLEQYVQLGSLFFAIAVACYYLASGALQLLGWLLHFGECHYQVTLYLGERSCVGEALLDTGNRLTDPLTGKAVSIISRQMADRLLDGGLPDGVRYISYRTIRGLGGVIPVMTVGRMQVSGRDEQWFEDALVGISEESSFGKEYDVILNPGIIDSRS